MTISNEAYSQWLRDDGARPCVLLEIDTDPVRRLSVLPYASLPSDPLPNVRYDALIRGGVGYQERLSIDRQASASGNRIEIHNEDGSLDAWVNLPWHQRRVRAYFGDVTWSREDFRLVLDAVADRCEQRRGGMSILLLDKIARLNASVSDTLLGGTSDDAQRLMPWVFGEVFNVRPVLYDPATHYYVVHGTAVQTIIEVRDNGVPVGFELAPGGFKLLANPEGEVTCDVQGDRTGGTYRNTVAPLVRLLATQYGPAATRFIESDLDLANLNAFDLAHPQAVGVYVPDRATVQSLIMSLANSVGAHPVMSRLGQLRLLKVQLPAPGTPAVIRPQDYEFGSLDLMGQPLPVAAVRLGCCRNWAPSRQIAQIVYPEHREWYAEEWLTAVSVDPAVAAEWRVDTDADQENTLLIDIAEASAESARLLSLWKVPRKIVRVRGFAQALEWELGQPATVYGDRFGLEAGGTGQIIGLQADWTARTCDVEVLL